MELGVLKTDKMMENNPKGVKQNVPLNLYNQDKQVNK
jgi:hypothetical protein